MDNGGIESATCLHKLILPLASTDEQLRWQTYVLVRDDLDVLHMAGRLKDLAQHVLSDPSVQATDVERALVRLRRSASGEGTTRRHQSTLVPTSHGRCNGGRDRVGVLGNVQRRRGHGTGLTVLRVVEARRTSIGLGRGRQLSARGRSSVVSHREVGRGKGRLTIFDPSD